jgi:hypothetical protein
MKFEIKVLGAPSVTVLQELGICATMSFVSLLGAEK